MWSIKKKAMENVIIISDRLIECQESFGDAKRVLLHSIGLLLNLIFSEYSED